MKLWIWLLLSMLMLSFAGCQPTPAKPAVVKKAAGVAESQDNEGAAYAFPATWSETIQYANFEVDIDAAIRADGNAPYSKSGGCLPKQRRAVHGGFPVGAGIPANCPA